MASAAMSVSNIKTAFAHTAIEPFFTEGTASVSEDQRILATAFADDVVLTSMDDGRRIKKIDGDSESVTTLALSPDGRFLVVCSRSLQMKIYELNLPEVRLVKSIKAHEGPVIVLSIDSTSTLVASGGADGVVKVWDLAGGFNTHTLRGHTGVISALRIFGQRGSTKWVLASGSDDTQVRIWDLVKRKCTAVLEDGGHVSVVRGLDFNVDGSLLISGGRDKVINVWSTKNYKLLNTILAFESLETVGFLARGILTDSQSQVIFSGGERGLVRLWSTTTGEELSTEKKILKTSEETSISDILYHPSWKNLYAVLSDQTITDQSLESIDLLTSRRILGNNGEVIDLAFVGPVNDEGFSPYLALASNSPEVRILSTSSLESSVLIGHTDIVICIDASSDGLWLASAGKDNEARIWHWTISDGRSGRFELYATFTGHLGSIGGVALARLVEQNKYPKFLVTGSQDTTVKTWSVPKRFESGAVVSKPIYTKKAHEKDINAVDIAPNDEFFATASQDRTIKIWDSEEGEVVGILRGHRRGVWSVKFSEHEKHIVSGSGDKTVKVWNLRDYTCIKTFEGHTNSVLKTIFISQGNQVASAGGDGLVKIWDIKSGECNSTLDNHEDKVWSLANRADDRVIASGGGDSVITFWEDITEQEIARKAEEAEALVEKEQDLANFIYKKEWKNAILLALSLDHPGRLLNLFSTVIANNEDPETIMGLAAVDSVIASLEPDQIGRLLRRVRDWNTRAGTFVVAQRILHVLLSTFPPEKLIEVPDIKKMLDALIPYSERHFNRMTSMMEDSYVLDFTLRQIDEVLSIKVED
ncbi:WD40-repeat-containing domain protein [Lipomyces oligophaga]|uniref:WD40-repeat-containing domain protein n=1 Tax=Lipomyces oligophaga TaxID=45792 RepID=UPI0034CF7CC7